MRHRLKLTYEAGRQIARRVKAARLVRPIKTIAFLSAIGLSAIMGVFSFIGLARLIRVAVESTDKSYWAQLATCATALIPAGTCVLEVIIVRSGCRALRARALRWINEHDGTDTASRECTELVDELSSVANHHIRTALSELESNEDSVDFGMVLHALSECCCLLHGRDSFAVEGVTRYLHGLDVMPAKTILDRLLSDGHSPTWLVDQLLSSGPINGQGLAESQTRLLVALKH